MSTSLALGRGTGGGARRRARSRIRACHSRSSAQSIAAKLAQMMLGTFGTLGILSLLKFRLIPATEFVTRPTCSRDSGPRWQAYLTREYQMADAYSNGQIRA
jgi:hypothetical protein